MVVATMHAHIESEYRRTCGFTEGAGGSKIGSNKPTPWLTLAKGDASLAAACGVTWRSIFSKRPEVTFEVPSTRRSRQLRAVEEWAAKETSSSVVASLVVASLEKPRNVATPQGVMPQGETLRGPLRFAWLPKLDVNVMGMLCRTPFTDLLPKASWESLQALGITEFGPVEAMWQDITICLESGLAGDCTSAPVELAMLFQYYMVGLVDAQLLVRVLRRRVVAPHDPTEAVVGMVCGILSLDSHDTILGIMAKSGCVGKQLWKEESKAMFISPFPTKLATTTGVELKITNEAALLEQCEKVGQGAVDVAAEALPGEVEAGEVVSKLTEPGLKADALATLLCIAKYNCGARTYRTQWASLYAGELPILVHTLLTPISSLCCACGPQDGL